MAFRWGVRGGLVAGLTLFVMGGSGLGAASSTPVNTVVATITVGSLPLNNVVAGDSAYVATAGLDRLTVIDTTTNAVSETIVVGDGPDDVAVTGGRAYVTNTASESVSVIDLATSTLSATILTDKPRGIAIAGQHAYVANETDGTLSVIDVNPVSPQFNTVTAIVNVGTSPVSVAIDGNRAYVVNYGSSNVSIVDTDTNVVVATVPVGLGPDSIAVASEYAYVTNLNGQSISVISTSSRTVVKTINLGPTSPRGIAVVGSTAFVAAFEADELLVIDTVSDVITSEISVGDGPFGIALTQGYAYVTNFWSGTVTVIYVGVQDSGSTPSDAPPPVLQQFGAPVTGACSDVAPRELDWARVGSSGWSLSWAQWMNKGAGGAVCTRMLVHAGSGWRAS